ncbi:MAG: hypothetical protein AAF414_20115 [Pseudomonadota bacterium]
MRRQAKISRPYGAIYGDHYRDRAFSDGELLVSIENSLRIHDHDHRFHKSLLGRILSPLLGLADPRWIEIDGKRLKHLFALTAEAQADEIAIEHMYVIGVATLRRLLHLVGTR